MMRVLIVDDEPLGRRRIRQLLEQEPDVEIAGECANGQEALALLARDVPDLVFLDVQMPALNGFEVLARLAPGALPVVVFVTAYDRYAIQAFEVNALDYLLKPFDRERFREALRRARQHLQHRQLDAVRHRLLALLQGEALAGAPRETASAPKRLAVRDGGRVQFVPVDEIDYVEAAANYVCLHAGRQRHLLRETMNGIEAKLDPGQFLRIHRSTIVHVARIRSLEPQPGGEYLVVLHDGTRLTASRSYRDQIQSLLAGS